MIGILLADRLIQLALIYAGLHFILIGMFNNSLSQAAAGLLIDLRYVLYFVVVYGTLRLHPTYRDLFIKVFVGGAIVVLGFAALQVFILPRDILAHIGYSKATIAPYLLVDENPMYVRINSTLRGPNPLGAYAVIVLAIVAAYVLRMKLTNRRRWIASIWALAAVLSLWVSYSRSSVIGAIVALLIVAGAAVPVTWRKRVGWVAAVVIVVAGASLFALRGTTVVKNIALHDNPSTGASIDSDAGHANSVVDGTKLILREPLGAGVGSTGSASLGSANPIILENQYLFVAHETGWLGLILFAWLFVEIERRLWKRKADAWALGVFAGGIGLAVIGLLLPVWVDDTVSIVWWGLAAVLLGGNDARKSH